MRNGQVFWSEYVTRNGEAAREFWTGSAGWTYRSLPLDEDAHYTVCFAGDHAVCGLVEADDGAAERPATGWITYFVSDDIEAACARVAASGGRVLRPPEHLAGLGRLAVCADPQGVVFGFATPETALSPDNAPNGRAAGGSAASA